MINRSRLFTVNEVNLQHISQNYKTIALFFVMYIIKAKVGEKSPIFTVHNMIFGITNQSFEEDF